MTLNEARRSQRSRKSPVRFIDEIKCHPVQRNILRITRNRDNNNYNSQVLESVSLRIYKEPIDESTSQVKIEGNVASKSGPRNVTDKRTKSKRKTRKTLVVKTDSDTEDNENDSDYEIKPKSKRVTSKSTPAKAEGKVFRLTNKKKPKQITKQEAIEVALDRLHSSSVPDSLPCRESQFEDIYSFVEQKLLDGEGGCMYISGVPGTGKTTTLYEVKRKLEQCADLPSFKFIEINGVRLGDPKQFYPHLLMELNGQKRTISQSLNILNNRFTDGKPNKKFIVLLVDELDFLRTKTQNLLYNVFDWPSKQNSRLIVLAIANTMDLPERFMLKFSSRIAFTRLSFQPYNFKELEQIVRSRLADLGNSDVFEPDALQLICRKVAALSGDARRVLDICRRSVEICMADKRVQITMNDVDKALQEIFNSIKISRIRFASTQEQIFLKALIQDFRMSGLEESRFLDVYNNHIEICRFEGQYMPTTTELTKVATNLDLSKIILFQKSPSHLYRRISLNISSDDITFALNLGDD